MTLEGYLNYDDGTDTRYEDGGPVIACKALVERGVIEIGFTHHFSGLLERPLQVTIEAQSLDV